MKSRKAYTMIELLAVIGIIAALLSLILPTLSRAREEAKRTVCMANEHSIGQAFYLYARTAPEVFPAISQTTTATSNNFQMFSSQDRTTEPSTTGTPSPSVDLWAIVRMNYALPKQFICPSTSDIPDPAVDTSVYYDFLSISNLSYGYQWQHSENRRIIGVASEPTFPVLADGNPYIKGGVTTGLTADRNSASRGNSANHLNREGQNILFQDAHVEFERGPDVGLSGKSDPTVRSSRGKDNCYAYFKSITDPVDPGIEKPSWTPSSGKGTVLLGGGRSGKSDACLIP